MGSANEDVAKVFEEIGDLERNFAQVELDALRRKEFSLKPLYEKRKALLERVPDFWPMVFGNGPEEVQQFFSPSDLALVSSITSFSVERYQIQSAETGEPRSLRFIFEFGDNDIIEDKKLVKDFEYKPRDDGPGSLVSKPVSIKFKNKKKDVTHGLLDAAVELYQAEEALKLKKGDNEVDIVDREALWQHEKLREKMVKLDESPEEEPSFFNWFGFRGAVGGEQKPGKHAENGVNGADEDEEEDEDEDVDKLLEVEIFPAGEEIAITLAEELWSDAMDYFMSAHDEDSLDVEDFAEFENADSSEDEEIPELVETDEARPRKKQRQA